MPKKNQTTLTPERRKTIPPRGKGKRACMLQAIKDVCKGGEDVYLKEVVKASLGDGKAIKPNPQLMQIVMHRLQPVTKTVLPIVNFKYKPNGDPVEQIDEILAEISRGEMPADVGNVIISMIQARMKVKEICEFEERLAQLEQNAGL